MWNQDWEKVVDDVKRTVQNAVDSRDFSSLNQTITNTINDAVDGVGRSLRNAGETVDKTAKSFQHRTNRKAGQPTDSAYQYQYQHQSKGGSGRKQVSELFANVSGAKAGGIAMSVSGGILGISMFLLLVIFVLRILVTDDMDVTFIFLSVIAGILLAGGAVLAGLGSALRSKVNRYQFYRSRLDGREYCGIKEFAEELAKSQKYILKDIRKMIHRKWFLQGHIDKQETCFIASDRAYTQYNELMDHMESQRQQEQLEKQMKREREEQADPQILEIVREGEAYIRKIQDCNTAIPGDEISAKITRIEVVVDRIFDRVRNNPENASDIRRLMEYYLPTTVKLLEAYKELDATPIQGENILSSKREIEKTLDTLNIAFEKLLDSLFEDTAWNVAADISVLNTMLAQEGLTKDDF